MLKFEEITFGKVYKNILHGVTGTAVSKVVYKDFPSEIGLQPKSFDGVSVPNIYYSQLQYLEEA